MPSMTAINGSSPRAWGTHRRRDRVRGRTRFIPTGVGNTPEGSAVSGCPTVHPHGRGEHTSMGGRFAYFGGSSPRAWGTLDADGDVGRVSRFIPTGVGNTSTDASGNPRTTVHPHGRGEHRRHIHRGERDRGSSPRAWGTPQQTRWRWPAPRFIPTGVGNTNPPQDEPHRHAVHPHGRGEHITATASSTPVAGSSPRAWGTRRCRRCR